MFAWINNWFRVTLVTMHAAVSPLAERVCCLRICAYLAWGNGWLQSLGFIDFAGSVVVHQAGQGNFVPFSRFERRVLTEMHATSLSLLSLLGFSYWSVSDSRLVQSVLWSRPAFWAHASAASSRTERGNVLGVCLAIIWARGVFYSKVCLYAWRANAIWRCIW